jgi:UrcA family protein
MIRTLTLAAIAAAFALPALAEPAASVTIKVAGLDAKTAHAAILQAAQEACRTELTPSSMTVRFYAQQSCVSDTVARAETKFSEMNAFASR